MYSREKLVEEINKSAYKENEKYTMAKIATHASAMAYDSKIKKVKFLAGKNIYTIEYIGFINFLERSKDVDGEIEELVLEEKGNNKCKR